MTRRSRNPFTSKAPDLSLYSLYSLRYPMRYYIPLLLLIALFTCAASCEDPLGTSPEAVADRIRANTPTELPPITSEGLNTMGAYIHTDTGRVLFVASGVERPDPIGAGSTDCDPFQNYRFSSDSLTSIVGRWCPRPEITDERSMRISIGISEADTVLAYFSYRHFTNSKRKVYIGNSSSVKIDVLSQSWEQNTISGTFSFIGVNRDPPYDTILVTDGRFDVTYGLTP